MHHFILAAVVELHDVNELGYKDILICYRILVLEYKNAVQQFTDRDATIRRTYIPESKRDRSTSIKHGSQDLQTKVVYFIQFHKSSVY